MVRGKSGLNRKFHQFIIVMLVLKPLSACSLWAVLADQGFTLHNDSLLIREQLEQLQSLTETYQNRNGWGMAMGGGWLDSIFIHRSALPAADDPDFIQTVEWLLSDTLETVIATGHVRNASSGASDIPDPHPFHYQWNGTDILFSHHGAISKSALMDLFYPGSDSFNWMNDHPPQTFGCGSWYGDGYECIVDSELYFLWLIYNIEQTGSILDGVMQALRVMESHTSLNAAQFYIYKNFTMTADSLIIGYRSIAVSMGYDYDLFFSDGSIDPNQTHKALMSEPPQEGPGSSQNWTPLDHRQLTVMTRDSETAQLMYVTLIGDLNLDNRVDILDIIVNMFVITGDIEADAVMQWAGDANSDGELDISDLTLMANRILGSYYSFQAPWYP